MPLGLGNDKSTLVQVMAWCRQATSHYLSQCWPRFMSPYGVTRPQWVNVIYVSLWYFLIIEESTWCLLVAWSLFGTRTSATIMMIKASHCISGVPQPNTMVTCWGSSVYKMSSVVSSHHFLNHKYPLLYPDCCVVLTWYIQIGAISNKDINCFRQGWDYLCTDNYITDVVRLAHRNVWIILVIYAMASSLVWVDSIQVIVINFK